ncbi:hypothetical protein BCR44DRAFT_1429187 [Catenaria anguillulae PL171]|uniref:Uncharacterized protein n=1 Tax=Catenaria anguillulae PL171 TaxID=765915 RepID=A0A1Y2HV70_9FUNG|nr:hypothetical protein BCR44DRAFT_1429187 [Catenaria anguillulae PL171]
MLPAVVVVSAHFHPLLGSAIPRYAGFGSVRFGGMGGKSRLLRKRVIHESNLHADATGLPNRTDRQHGYCLANLRALFLRN